jgi:4-amino-4-deoxychorismate lyase
MILVNGVHQQYIQIADRGFQYGDGLFETIEVSNSQLVFIERHLARLNTGCHRLHIPCPDLTLLTSEAQDLCRHSSRAVLKIIVTRGTGGRGYRQPDCIQPTRVLSLHPYPDFPDSYSEQGIVARICSTPLGLNPFLAGIKHMNRLEQVMARSEWTDPAIQEGIMLDVNAQVIEGTMTNLFYVKEGTIYTSSLAQAGVAGIMRGIIIELTANQGLRVIEHTYTQEQLLSADEIFVCNAIIGIWPIHQIEKVHFAVGPITRRLQQCLSQFKNKVLLR